MARLGLKRKPGTKLIVPQKPPEQAARFTPRQARFMDEWMIDRNGTQAAIRAGYAPRGARTEGARLLANAGIKAELEHRVAAERARLEVNGDWVVRELLKIAQANMGRYMKAGPDGAPLLDFSGLTEDDTAALQSVTVEEFKDGRSDKREVRRVKFALWDKPKALELLGKRFGLFAEQHEHRHQHTVMAVLLQEIDEEARAERAKLVNQERAP